MGYEAIILAGGLGTRLQTILSDKPKAMAPINGRPFLELVLINLASKGFVHVVISVGYLSDQIINYFGSKFHGMSLDYAIETVPLGTGGATKLALSFCENDHVFIFNGDTFIDLEVNEVDKIWQSKQAPIIVGKFLKDVSRYGVIQTKNFQVISFNEKNKKGPGIINAGCYLLKREQLKLFELNSFSLENEFFPEEIQKNIFYIFVSNALFIDIGIPEDYIKAQNILSNF
jgi:D-glycero-alpha-D-manno-heptose 1-phosphate guanylyltransferase